MEEESGARLFAKIKTKGSTIWLAVIVTLRSPLWLEAPVKIHLGRGFFLTHDKMFILARVVLNARILSPEPLPVAPVRGFFSYGEAAPKDGLLLLRGWLPRGQKAGTLSRQGLLGYAEGFGLLVHLTDGYGTPGEVIVTA